MPHNVLLADYLPREHIVVPLRSTTFRDALQELLQHAKRNGAVLDEVALDRALSAPRNRDVVSIGNDVALPHFRTDAVQELVVSLGIARKPLDPGETTLVRPPRIVVLILAPVEATTLYLQAVAALAQFFKSQTVVDRLVAAGDASEVLAMPELRELKIKPQLTVQDLMTRDPVVIEPDATVHDAVELLVTRRLRALIVVSERRQVLGLVTEWDVMRALLPHIPRPGETEPPPEEEDEPRVRDVMTRAVLCISEEMGLQEAVNLMINKNVEQCPVVDDGALIGVLTRSDIIRKLFG